MARRLPHAGESGRVQSLRLSRAALVLLASPQGEQGSLQLRQQAWVHQVTLAAGESLTVPLNGRRTYLQSVYGQVEISGPRGLTGTFPAATAPLSMMNNRSRSGPPRRAVD